jgi:hypothetical protein
MNKRYILKTHNQFGAEIVCTQNTWDKIQQFHPEIRNINEIETTISDPDTIAIDKNIETTDNYYRKCTDKLLPQKKYTKVCVSRIEKPYKIATAFGDSKIHEGDKPLWTK